MKSDDEFTQRLTEFALSEKEARVYLQLLKCGPQPAVIIAKRLKTHRVDVHRTLRLLVKKGMTRQSLSKPAVHAAMPLKDALDAVLRQEAIELQCKEEVKHELIRLASRLTPLPSEEFCSYRVVTGCKECIAASLEQAEAATHEILTIGHSAALAYSYKQGFFNTFLDAVERGVEMRFILDVSPHALDAVRAAIDGGVDVRHYDQYRGIMFTVVDCKESFTVVTFDAGHSPPDTEHTAFLCDNLEYARGLANQFDLVWEQSRLSAPGT
jgi:HTH-type transcriptional regulator, sugar sensing transcriptional regulator